MFLIPIHSDQSHDNRTIPLEPPAFPSSIADRDLMAAVLVPSRVGEHPYLAVLVLRDPGIDDPARVFAVLDAYSDDGTEWGAYNGDYDCSYTIAMEIFRERLNSRT